MNSCPNLAQACAPPHNKSMNILHRLASGLCLVTLCSVFAFTAYSGETTLNYNPPIQGPVVPNVLIEKGENAEAKICRDINKPEAQRHIKFCEGWNILLDKSIEMGIELYTARKEAGGRPMSEAEIDTNTAHCKLIKKAVRKCVTVPPTDVGEIKDEAYKGKKQFSERIPPALTPQLKSPANNGKADLPQAIRLGGTNEDQ